MPPIASGLLKGLKIALGDSRPDHFSPHGIGISADLFHTHGVIEQAAHSLCDGLGIMERNQDATSIRKQFLRMPIGSGDNGLSCPDHIGEGARGHLRLVRIGCKIDVCRTHELLQVIR